MSWLTDYIGGGSTPVEITCVLTGVANRNTGTNTTVIPTPNCAEVGDWQVVAWTYWTNSTPNWDTVGFGKNLGDWWMVNAVSATNSFVDGPAISMRKITPGNINTPFTVGIASGALGMAYVSWIMKGEQIQDFDPVIASVSAGTQGWNASSTLTNMPHRKAWTPTMLPVASDLDLIGVTAGGTSAVFVPPESESIPLSQQSPMASFPAGCAVVLQRRSFDNYVDLNGQGDPMSGWTLHNVDNPAPPTSAQAYNIGQTAISGARFGIWKDFYLEAGKTYAFTFDCGSVVSTSTGGFGTCPYMGYVGPDMVEHGIGGNNSFNTWGVIGNVLTVNDYIRHIDYDNNGLGGAMWAQSLMIRPSQTGTHRLWVCICQQQDLATLSTSLDNLTGNVNRRFRGRHISVVEIKDEQFETWGGAMKSRNNPAYRDYTWRERLKGVDRNGQSSSQNKQSFTVFRGNSNPRPLVRMGGTAVEGHITASAGNNRTVTNEELYPFNTNRWFVEYSDQAVGPWIYDRFYFEYTIDTYAPKMGIGLAHASYYSLELITQIPVTNNGLRYTAMMLADSSTWFDNAYTAAPGSPAQAGDVIGVLLDYSLGRITFTLNGNFWGAWDLPTTAFRRYAMYKVMGMREWNNVPDASRYTLNLTGPFSYKPPCSLAFDFDNEVGSTPPATITSDGLLTTKSADETRLDNTALVADTHLKATLTAGKKYAFTFLVYITGQQSSNFRGHVHYTGGGGYHFVHNFQNYGAGAVDTMFQGSGAPSTLAGAFGTGMTQTATPTWREWLDGSAPYTDVNVAVLSGYIDAGAGGELRLMWRPDGLNQGVGTTVLTGSKLYIEEVT